MASIRARSTIFYVLCSVVLLVMVTKGLTHVLPARLAHEIDDESEAFPIALLACAYLQFVWTPSGVARRPRWGVALAVAALCWIVAWLLLNLGLPSSVATLNESFVAVGAIVIYVTLPRPLPAGFSLGLFLALVALIVVFNSTSFVTTQAESLVPIALMPIAFDWADRAMLDPSAPDAPGRRAIWCVLLVAIPVIARLHVNLVGVHDVFRYERRATEGFLGLLLVHVYFSYWLGSYWRERIRALSLLLCESSGDLVSDGRSSLVEPRPTSPA